MLNARQYGIFAKVTSRQAKIADVGSRLIISKATAVAVGTSWGKQREQLERKARMSSERVAFIRWTEQVLRKD